MENTTLSTQLRIGNWIEVFTVKNRWEQLQIRSGLDIEEVMKAEEDPDDDRFRPIELSVKWLEKFGLNLTDWLCENSYQVVKDEDYGYCIKVRNAAHTKSIEFAYFNHVHQLQNLYFALTGEELIIKE